MPWARKASTGSIVSTLPTSPVDGQIILYQASGAMAASGIIWQFRYNSSSSSTYKWEFVGGSDLSNAIDTNQSITTSGWQNLATDGPSITIPLAGDYSIAINAQQSTSDGNAQTTAIGFVSGDNNPPSTNQAIFHPIYNTNAQTGYCEFNFNRLITGVSALTSYKIRYYVNSSTSGHSFQNRKISIVPVRVG